MGGLPSASTSQRCTVAHTVVSVGPYALNILRPAAQRFTTAEVRASPATIRLSTNPALCGIRCKEAPWHRAITTSKAEASKLYEANCRQRLAAFTPNVIACAVARLLTPECWTIAPLGLPVEPEV